MITNQQMEEEISLIIQEMALGNLGSDDTGYECVHCGARDSDCKAGPRAFYEREIMEVPHRPGCTIPLARKVLRDQETPLNVYHMSAEGIYMKSRKREHWSPVSGYTLAISEAAAIRNWQGESTRNIKAEFVEVFSEEE